MDLEHLGESLARVRATSPLVHSITNYVTANDCANALLACGASPIMSDDAAEVADITSICGGLVLNIGTLNQRSIEGMRVAGARSAELDHPIVVDPVGAGASALRTRIATELVDTLPVTVVRGNMSEIKAIAGAAASTRGVDAGPDDAITRDNLESSAEFARELAARLHAIIAITGAIDIVADETRVRAITNGVAMMSSITGTGCMLSCLVGAHVIASFDERLDAVVSAVACMGIAGEVARARMDALDGSGSFRIYLIDAICNMDAPTLDRRARVEVL
ncbi:hydroxyethylthiazole kinase [Coriobacterium glomerans PW2]|uniref:Hydroxyethylthiazole kinase n=1 Tax=Coriobacterium glomerans (strain ATCC 49209 / DSM 20642 / JCM 10262 / PW2) TaxID=700015 RepID=F2N8E5_CORGP|nr:hydroxyethylthiazole kinase [Coriobacterium glomerans]AEB07328.1 hydroxyethylthiazole kinase [Coriobacterium glomerans PW2]